MINVSVNSWHYRLLDWTYGNVPHNLCPYFDKLAIAIVVSPFLLFSRSVTGNIKTFVAFEGISFFYSLYFFETAAKNNIILALIEGHALSYVWVGFMYFGLPWLIRNHPSSWHFPSWPNWLRWHPRVKVNLPSLPRVKKPKQASLLGEWIHAKHRKICPFIEFSE